MFYNCVKTWTARSTKAVIDKPLGGFVAQNWFQTLFGTKPSFSSVLISTIEADGAPKQSAANVNRVGKQHAHVRSSTGHAIAMGNGLYFIGPRASNPRRVQKN